LYFGVEQFNTKKEKKRNGTYLTNWTSKEIFVLKVKEDEEKRGRLSLRLSTFTQERESGVVVVYNNVQRDP
jgi:hypothetical protein